MKTLDEVIDIFEAYSKCRYDLYEGPGQQTVTDALHYLKLFQTDCERVRGQLEDLKQEYRPNDPLTWDELKQMEGRPVWLEDSNQQGEWVLLSGMEDDVLYFVYRTCNEYKIYRKEQGTFWQAYRKERTDDTGRRYRIL